MPVQLGHRLRRERSLKHLRLPKPRQNQVRNLHGITPRELVPKKPLMNPLRNLPAARPSRVVPRRPLPNRIRKMARLRQPPAKKGRVTAAVAARKKLQNRSRLLQKNKTNQLVIWRAHCPRTDYGRDGNVPAVAVFSLLPCSVIETPGLGIEKDKIVALLSDLIGPWMVLP